MQRRNRQAHVSLELKKKKDCPQYGASLNPSHFPPIRLLGSFCPNNGHMSRGSIHRQTKGWDFNMQQSLQFHVSCPLLQELGQGQPLSAHSSQRLSWSKCLVTWIPIQWPWASPHLRASSSQSVLGWPLTPAWKLRGCSSHGPRYSMSTLTGTEEGGGVPSVLGLMFHQDRAPSVQRGERSHSSEAYTLFYPKTSSSIARDKDGASSSQHWQ